jgi:hypothetical protein
MLCHVHGGRGTLYNTRDVLTINIRSAIASRSALHAVAALPEKMAPRRHSRVTY